MHFSWPLVNAPASTLRMPPFRIDGIYALVVPQTYRVQEQIENLLNDLRELRVANPILGN